MKCTKCGSENVNIQAVTVVSNKHHGFLWWLFIGWWWLFIKWIFFTLPALIVKLFSKKNIKSEIKSMAVCQSCGYKWAV